MRMTDSQPGPRAGGRGAGGPGAENPGPGGRADGQDGADLGVLLGQVARGDEDAYGVVYAQLAGHVLGVARSVLRRAPCGGRPGPREAVGDDAGPPAVRGPGAFRAALGRP